MMKTEIEVPSEVRELVAISIDNIKKALAYRRTGHPRAVQLLLGHTKTESTVRYLGIESR
jgi:hypothetical protein